MTVKINVEDVLKIMILVLIYPSERGKYSVFVKTNTLVRLFYLLPPRIWVPRDQTQPGSFSRERKEAGNEVALEINSSCFVT